MVGFSIACLVFALGCLLVALAALWLTHQQQIRAHNDAKEFNKSAIESLTRYGVTIMQGASAIEEKIHQRVAQRVKMINAIANPPAPGEEPPPPVVGDAPPMGTSGIVDDVHEIARGLHRVRREGVPEELIRDPGVGTEFETAEDGTVTQGGKPLEI